MGVDVPPIVVETPLSAHGRGETDGEDVVALVIAVETRLTMDRGCTFGIDVPPVAVGRRLSIDFLFFLIS